LVSVLIERKLGQGRARTQNRWRRAQLAAWAPRERTALPGIVPASGRARRAARLGRAAGRASFTWGTLDAQHGVSSNRTHRCNNERRWPMLSRFGKFKCKHSDFVRAQAHGGQDEGEDELRQRRGREVQRVLRLSHRRDSRQVWRLRLRTAKVRAQGRQSARTARLICSRSCSRAHAAATQASSTTSAGTRTSASKAGCCRTRRSEARAGARSGARATRGRL